MPSRSVDDLVPEAKEKCLAWLAACGGEGLKVRVYETYRSQEEQDHNYALGRSLPGRIITWTRNSYHTKRRAWDFCVLDAMGHAVWDEKEYRRPAELAKDLGLNAGYFWNKQDCPHIQLDEEKGVA